MGIKNVHKHIAYRCEVLRVQGGLVQLGRVTIEEQVIVFLNILARHQRTGVSK